MDIDLLVLLSSFYEYKQTQKGKGGGEEVG